MALGPASAMALDKLGVLMCETHCQGWFVFNKAPAAWFPVCLWRGGSKAVLQPSLGIHLDWRD